MQAIVMAGGGGSRLRPLTCGRPKPMMPVLNKPMMEHIIELLKKHNVTKIGVTLQYRPDDIRDYFNDGSDFGVDIQYFTEDTPLGTAGSVKNAEDFLTGTFIVISGDALTDFDLTRALEFHRQKRSMATLVLTKVECPLEYGVVITAEDGRVKQFLEKPSWGEVFSDQVNTGIYILEPEVLNYFKQGEFFDFSRDLFPKLLEDGKPMYGVVLPGYWCDIGDLQQYIGAHEDILTGKVEVGFGEKNRKTASPSTSVYVDKTAVINEPVVMGSGCHIGAHAEVGPFTVLGSGTLVGDYASVKRSITWDNTYLGAGTEIRGVVVGSRSQIQAGARLYEGVVIGEDTQVKEGVEIKPGVKIWPGKTVEIGEIINQNIVWGNSNRKNLFGIEGIRGLPNIELTPEFATKVGASYGSVIGKGGKIAVSSDSSPFSIMLKNSVICGAQSVGGRVLDLGVGITPMNRFAVSELSCKGGIHVKLSGSDGDKSTLVFMDEHGGNIGKGMERKIENLFSREDYKRVDSKQVIAQQLITGLPEKYIQTLTSHLDLATIKERKLNVLIVAEEDRIGRFVSLLVEKLGLNANVIEDKEKVSETIRENHVSLGVLLDGNGEQLILFDEQGCQVEEETLCLLTSLITLKFKKMPVVVPVTASGNTESLAKRYNGEVIRAKTSTHDLFHKLLSTRELTGFYMQFDALSALAGIIEFLSVQDITLTQAINEIPEVFMHQEEIEVPWGDKGRVIRKLIENPLTDRVELIDGVKSYHPKGWSLVLPDPEMPLCRVIAEGVDMEAAESLTDMYTGKINDILNSKQE